MKNLITYIKESIARNRNVTEGSIEKFTDHEWLDYTYCGNRTNFYDVYSSKPIMYIREVAANKYEIHNVDDADRNALIKKLKENKAIKNIYSKKNNPGNDIIVHTISFIYYPEKDEIRKRAQEEELAEEKRQAEEFQRAVDATDFTKYVTTPKDIEKVKSYYNRRSNPVRLVKSIKDGKKLVARWIAAMKIGWTDADTEFSNAIRYRKLLTVPEIVAYSKKYQSDEEQIDDNTIRRMDNKQTTLATSWVTKSAFRWIDSLSDKYPGLKIEWLDTFDDAKTKAGQDIMTRNARAWTEGFSLLATNGNKKIKIIFDIVTNEGGGLYGYAFDSAILNLKNFKSSFERKIQYM